MPQQPFHYVVSAARESVINHSVTGAFTAEDAVDVICDKGTRVEVRSLRDNDRLELVASVPVFGRVEALRLIRAGAEQQKDWLFVLTSRYYFFVLAFEGGKIVEKAHGDLSERVSRKNNCPLVAVDPKSRYVVCALYQGLLTIIPFDSRNGLARDAVAMPLEELRLLDMCMSGASGRSLLCVLYEDNRQVRHIKTYEVPVRTARELSPGQWSQQNVDPTSCKLVPALDGVLLFSSTSITHLRESGVLSDSMVRSSSVGSQGPTPGSVAPTSFGLSVQPTTMTILCGEIQAVGAIEIDNSRFLLGDRSGGLHALSLAQIPHQANLQMTTELLGETSIASGICYLDAGVVFIASNSGDSQLIRLLPERDEPSQSFVELLDTFTNLGPITSMCVVDIDKQGRGQIVTCSGARKDGSLRVIRNGVGADEQCSVDLPGIKGMWSLQASKGASHDSFLALSFPTETRVFGFDEAAMETEDSDDIAEESLSELTPGSAFDVQTPSLLCANVQGQTICQVTPTRVRFMPCTVLSGEMNDVVDWNPPSGTRITIASSAVESSDFGLVVALTGGAVVILGWSEDEKKVRVVAQLQMEQEVACAGLCQGLLAVGLWTDLSVRIIHVATGKELYCEKKFGEDALPRSVVLTRFGSPTRSMHLLVGLGDGRLVIFNLKDESTGSLQPSSRRTVTLGAQPLELSLFKDLNGTESPQLHVFAACDRPAVIFVGANEKLLISNVNVDFEVNRTTTFDSEQFPGCLAFASEDRLIIGTVNDVQRLHIRTIPLHEQPRRITHQEQSNTYAVCTMPEEDDEFPDTGYVRILDDRTFEIIDSYRLDELEHSISVVSTSFATPSQDVTMEGTATSLSSLEAKMYYVVGTAYADDEIEPTRGRILVFEVVRMDSDERKLNLVAEKQTNGAVYDLCPFKGKLLAAINKNVQLYGWNEAGLKLPTRTATATPGTSAHLATELLSQECGYNGFTISLFVRSEGDNIIVGDLTRSITLLRYDADKNKLEEKARDFSASRWVSSIATLEEDMFLVSDVENNMSIMRPEFNQTDEPGRLVYGSDVHWGDFINAFAKGSLVMRSKQDEEEASSTSSTAELVKNIRAQPKLLFGTAGGAIGVLASLNEKEFALLNRLQVAMNEIVTSLGGGKCRFLDWRAFRYGNRSSPCTGFIDGDLVEMLLEMTSADVERVAELMNRSLSDKSGSVVTDEPPRVTGADLITLVEDLARMH